MNSTNWVSRDLPLLLDTVRYTMVHYVLAIGHDPSILKKVIVWKQTIHQNN